MTSSTENKQPVIAIDQLLALALSALDNYFFKSHKEKARKLYKEIAAGEAVDLASLTFNEGRSGPIKVKLGLDYSAYKGHLTFHIFKLALEQMLRNIAGKLNQRQDLNLFTSEESSEVIILLPGLVRNQENVNVLVLGIKPARNTALLKLQFLDPDQFLKEQSVADQEIASVNENDGEERP